MISYLNFEKLGNIELIDLTDNTIVLFNTKEGLQEFKQEFEKLIENQNYEHVIFSTDNLKETVDIKKIIICRDITGIYKINDCEQRIILTVEPISMLLINDHSDLWLIDKNEDKWNCFAFTEYNNVKFYKNKEDIYQFICESKYGCNINKK